MSLFPMETAEENRTSIRNHPHYVQLFCVFLGEPGLEKN